MKKLSKKDTDIEGAILLNKNKLIISKLKFHKLLKGQVLVKIYYTSIWASQLMEIEGKRGKDNFLPHMLGHEASGMIVKIGPGVKKFKVGDKIVAGWIKTNNKNYNGFQLKTQNEKTINAGPITTFSNFSIIYENRITKLPKNLQMKEATLYGCAVPTGAGIVFNQIKPKKNHSVLVIGLGAVGICAIAALSCFKVKNIIAIDKNLKRLKVAKKLGATKVINASHNNFDLKLKKRFPDGVDFCVESAGKTETIEYGFSSIKDKTGKLFFASHPDEKKVIRLKPHDLIRGRQIYGSWGGMCKPKRDIPKIYNMFRRNKIKLTSLLSNVYSLKNINKAVSDFKKGKIIRPIIKMIH